VRVRAIPWNVDFFITPPLRASRFAVDALLRPTVLTSRNTILVFRSLLAVVFFFEFRTGGCFQTFGSARPGHS